MNEAKAPKFEMEMEDAEGRMIHPDWTVVVSNQITIITQQSAMIGKQEQMIAELKKIADPMLTGTLVKQQRDIVEAVNNLSVHMDDASEQLAAAVVKMSGAVWGLLKVPVACVVVGVASWAFLYSHEISENTWLIIMGVAVFPWLGDSITAMMKLFGIRQGQQNGAEKK